VLTQELVTNLEKHRARHAFRDRTNHFEEPEKIYKKTEVGSAIDPPLDIDCQEMNIERMPLAEDKKKPVLKKEQYVEDLQAEIFDYCMRTEVGRVLRADKEPVQDQLLPVGADRDQREDALDPHRLAGRCAREIQDEAPDLVSDSEFDRSVPRTCPNAAVPAPARWNCRHIYGLQIRGNTLT
jgi:hypothetical protein